MKLTCRGALAFVLANALTSTTTAFSPTLKAVQTTTPVAWTVVSRSTSTALNGYPVRSLLPWTPNGVNEDVITEAKSVVVVSSSRKKKAIKVSL